MANSQPSPDWLGAAADQLARLDGQWSDKKRATIIALVDARLAGKAEETVWNRAAHPNVCSRTVYHGKWKHDPVFAEVLATVTKLAKEWRDGRALRALQQAAERLALASPVAAGKLTQLLNAPDPSVALRAATAILDRAGMETATKTTAVQATMDADTFARLTAQARAEAAALDAEAAAAWDPDAQPEGGPNAD